MVPVILSFDDSGVFSVASTHAHINTSSCYLCPFLLDGLRWYL